MTSSSTTQRSPISASDRSHSVFIAGVACERDTISADVEDANRGAGTDALGAGGGEGARRVCTGDRVASCRIA